MKKFLMIATLIFGVGFTATSVHAGTINFAEYAAGNEGGIHGNSEITFDSGETIRFFTGNWLIVNNLGEPVSFPYFDDANAGGPAGLGVCRSLNGAAGNGAPGAECLDPGDASIDGDGTVTESIWLKFVDSPFNIRSLSFRDGELNDLNNSDGLVQWFAITTTGALGGTNTFAELVAMAIAGDLDGIKFFGLAFVDTEFYLSGISDVPIPGAIPLLLSGLAGIGFAARKKKST